MKDLSDCAIQCLMGSEESARLMGLPVVLETNMLLGMLSCREGLAARTLETMGVNFATVSSMTEVRQPVKHYSRPIPFSPDAAALVARGLEEQSRHNHSELNSGHLLLGLIGSSSSEAMRLLRQLCATEDLLRSEILKAFDGALYVEDFDANKASGLTELINKMTPEMRAVMLFAERESRASGHFYLSTEHLLIGLVGQGYLAGDQPDSELVPRIRMRAQEINGPGSGWALKNVPITPRTLHLLRSASDKANSCGRTEISAADVSQVLIESREGIAARIIENLNLRLIQTARL
jgi:ATP-dependent Clp protease ATP-binding subunit ClpA